MILGVLAVGLAVTMVFAITVAYQGRFAFASPVNRSKQPLMWVLVTAVSVYAFSLVALRPLDAGHDTARYLLTFGKLTTIGSSAETGLSHFGNTEYLWWPFQALFADLLDARHWLVVNFLLVYFFVYFAYRCVSEELGVRPAAFCLVFLTFFLVYSGNVMRQALAIPICILGLYYVLQKHTVRGAALLIVSVGFHWSCLSLLLVIPVFLIAPRRRAIYLLIPVCVGLASSGAGELIGAFVKLIGISGISAKFDLYFSGAYQSHLGEIWKTANFWICVTFSFLFLSLCEPMNYMRGALHSCVSVALSLILLGLKNADFSERYLPFVLFLLPLIAFGVVKDLRLPNVVKNFAFTSFFMSLAVFVFFSNSAQITLGYSLVD